MPTNVPIVPIRVPILTPSAPVYAGSSSESIQPAVWGASYSTLPNQATQTPGTLGSGAGVLGSSGSGQGVVATSDSGVGLQASSSGGNAVQATCTADTDAIVATSSSPNHAAVSGHNNSGGFGLWASSTATGGQGGIGVYATGAKYAALFDGPVQVNGTLTATQDIVLGSDCAEDFDIASSTQIDPGTVMVLTDDGTLQPSQEAYDRKVAGVISGAGDYKPGLILGRRDSSAERMPLALVGRVYCRVDARYAPIEVGDLLTTSPTPGHAMRAADPLKAFGAVIGKALRPWRLGQGLVPILVALQ
jgi:hypothetical protein